jgi:ankyrin repeat protein
MTDNINITYDDFPIKIKHIRILFDLIKSHKFDEFIDYIEKVNTEELDVNIRDDQNNYLIQFAIIMNNPIIVQKLILFGSKLDFTDTDGLSILYYPIRYDYPDIFNILLEENKNNVGVSLIDLRDNYGMVPLHYAIRYRNLHALTKLLANNADPNYKNKEQYNALHLAVIKRDVEMVTILVKYIKNINAKTNGGDTALHQACNFQLYEIAKILLDNNADPNMLEFEHDFTPIFYTVALNNIEMTRLLIKYKANPNHQDYQGNTVIHYCIIYKYYHLFSVFIESYSIKNNSKSYYENIGSESMDSYNHINPNIINLDGDTILHLLLYQDQEQEELFDSFITKLLPHANLNIQDNNGNTILHLLTMNTSQWIKFIPILEKKKLNIYIENNDKIRPIDTVLLIDRELFINTVAKSYLHYLKTHQKKWLLNWQIECGSNNNQDINTDSKCLELIRQQILEQKLSIPLKKNNIDINIEYYETLEFTTFTGSILDVTIGLIYLNKKYQFSTGIYNSNSNSSSNSNSNSNSTLHKYYQSLGITVYEYNYLFDIEILWIYQKIFFPELFDTNFNMILKSKYQSILIPIGIELSNGSHANYLIYWIQTYTLERFEPHGTHYPFQFNYNPTLLDDLLYKKIHNLIIQHYSYDPGFKYYKPTDYLPKIGFQMLDSNEISSHRNLGDPRGFCALWCIWYTDYRLKYADINPRKLVSNLIKLIKKNNYSFRKLIRNYSKQITTLRDYHLKQVGIDINQFLNNTIPFDKYIQLKKSILDTK